MWEIERIWHTDAEAERLKLTWGVWEIKDNHDESTLHRFKTKKKAEEFVHEQESKSRKMSALKQED